MFYFYHEHDIWPFTNRNYGGILEGTNRQTNIDIKMLEPIASHFKTRSRYRNFEGSLRGVDSRILISQVPGGMFNLKIN
ncbi:MAG: hypothetical protein CM15mP127_02030 [Gammaproteobacteria bacterium]|nr:MAG: hypothetical protein CM15mP127_02030 [Gammaproteobacteria bacterium]